MTAQQLKNSILQMAVQGKLVPQDPNDEPASVLLERIRAEKEKLIKAGKIKREKNPSVIFRGSDNLPYEKTGKETRCIADEIPFEIPESWMWIRLGQLCEIARGGSPRPIKDFITDAADGINWIKIGDSDKGGKYINRTREKIKPSGVSKSRMVHAGDFLLTNSMSFGRPYILNIDGCIHDGWLVLSGYQVVFDQDFLFLMLSSPFAYQQFCGIVSGAVVKNLNSDKVAESLFPLPPLAEQKRIVAKIEELLPHLDEYDQAETHVEKLNAEFPEQLKKSILQWAIKGRLVPQDPNDEPASVLLDRIRAEKAKLVRTGKIKKGKEESVIFRRDNSCYEKLNGVERCIDDEIPFEIPNSWAWARLGNIIVVKGGKRLPKGESFAPFITSHIYIRVTDMKGNTLINRRLHYISDRVYEMIKNYTIGKDDLYLTIAGTIGEVGIVPEEFDGMNLTENAVKLTDIKIDKYFLLFSIMSPYIQNQFVDKTKVVAQPKLAIERIVTALLPIPPLAEQKRIVEAIERLLCKLGV